MPTSLAALARLVGGTVVGDDSVEIEGAASLLEAGPGDITLVARNEKADRWAAVSARAAVVPLIFPSESLTMPIFQVEDVHRAFTAIVTHFRPPRPHRRIGVSPAATIDLRARLGATVAVSPGATIGVVAEFGAGSPVLASAYLLACGTQRHNHSTLSY